MPSPDITSDFTLFDNLETGAVPGASERVRATPRPCPCPTPSREPQPAARPDHRRRALLPKVTGYWDFWTAVLTPLGISPKVGDQFTDAGGTNWQVLSAELSKWQTGWRLLAQKMR